MTRLATREHALVFTVNRRSVMIKLWEFRIYLTFRLRMKQKPYSQRIMLRRKVYARDKGVCQICGRKIGLDDMSMHHIKPQASYPELKMDADNCQCLCHACHTELHRAQQLRANGIIASGA